MDFHRLETLSTAALYNTPEVNGISQSLSTSRSDFQSLTQARTPIRDAMGPPTSPPSSMTTSNNNLNFLLNSPSLMSPTIDPNLQGPSSNRATSFPSDPASSPSTLRESRSAPPFETKHEVAFLLRYFSETPGQWCVSRQLLS